MWGGCLHVRCNVGRMSSSCQYCLLQEVPDPRRKVSFEHDFQSKASSVLQQAGDALLRLKYKGTLEVCYIITMTVYSQITSIGLLENNEHRNAVSTCGTIPPGV